MINVNAENWKIKYISDLGTIYSGSTPSTHNQDFWNGDIAWITPNDLSEIKSRFIHSSERKITIAGLQSCSAKLLPAKSLVISSRAPIGYLALPTTNFCTNQGCKSIVFNPEQDPEFHYYNLLFRVKLIKEKGEGTTFSEISKSALSKIKIPVPLSISTQSKIAEVLSKIDKAIAQTETLIAKYKRVKTGFLSERLQILGYGTRDAYLEAMPIIEAKARDMVDHYIEYVFSGGFKAQVVATSREAACRYKQCFDAAIQAKITELEVNNPFNINIARMRELETAVVISGNNNDPPHIKAYTNSNYHNTSIQCFKLSFDATETAGNTSINGKVGIIIVNNMLLVGFDAPVEQVLYLDRVIRDHNLLQAIARVNRVGEEHKDKGFVVDYVGIGHHLKKALDTYQDKEQQEIISQIRDEQQEINDLILANREIWNFLEQYNLTDFSDADAFYDLFYDEDIRFAYILAFKKLTKAFNVVMPRKEALDYWQDYKNFIAINHLAYKHFRDARFSLKGIPKKLRNIADEFLKSHGIEQKVAPISIIDDNFETLTNSRTRTKTKAATVEHAIRNYINLNLNEDPELFLSFAEKLEEILTEFADNWERIYEEVEKLRKEIKSKEQENTYGLDRKTQMPIFRIFKAQLFDNRELNEDEITRNVNLTLHTFNLIKQEVQTAGFWASIPAQNRLKEELQKLFLSPDFVSYPNIVKQRKELISRLLEWSKENHAKLSGE